MVAHEPKLVHERVPFNKITVYTKLKLEEPTERLIKQPNISRLSLRPT